MNSLRSRAEAVFAVLVGLALVVGLGLAWSHARRPATRELDGATLPLTIRSESEPGPVAVMPPPAPNVGDAGIPPPAPEGREAAEELSGSVRVVFEGGDRPAAGADVYWFGSAKLAEGRWRDDFDQLGMGLDFFERNGRHFVTDAEGMARVPSSGAGVQVVATMPTHFGMTTIERGVGSKQEIALSLRPAFGVEVRVQSATTQAVVSDVVVVASCIQLPESRVGARTDERGIARLFPLFREADPRGTWYASLPGVFFDEIRVALPMEERAQPLELSLPESAPAVVRIVDKQGSPCPLSGKLRIGWNDREGDPVEPRELRITSGMANLTRIESGLSLHVRAKFPDMEEMPTSVFTLDSAGAVHARFDLVLESR